MRNELDNQGVGECSKPMWSGMGIPAGHCGKPAYGKQIQGKTFRNRFTNEIMSVDGRCTLFVPRLACPNHGGPRVRTFMDGNKWCAVKPDFVDLMESPAGFGDTREEAIKELGVSE
ncbi:hypothetical protein LCGC14_2464790 [marine sediment metagenome]|uniref:Uncharacterized protein n=1 Tax=marine sediment metagenome TaxID=412755 RepID=A0A0F9BCQ2_9ZZZZ